MNFILGRAEEKNNEKKEEKNQKEVTWVRYCNCEQLNGHK